MEKQEEAVLGFPLRRFPFFSPDLPWVQDVLGIEELLDALHQFQRRTVFLLHVLTTAQTNAVLARSGTTNREDEGYDLVFGLVGCSPAHPIGWIFAQQCMQNAQASMAEGV